MKLNILSVNGWWILVNGRLLMMDRWMMDYLSARAQTMEKTNLQSHLL